VNRGNGLLLQADELYRRNIITRGEFEAIERRVAETIAEANQALIDQSKGQEAASRTTFEYTEFVNGAAVAVDRLTEAEIRNGNETVTQSERRRAARAQERGFAENLLGGRSTFAQIGGGTFFVPAPVVTEQNGRVENP
jgi:hypothetical protein